ncbi:hypothetical protein, unlikely [Trypanosoma congolense IL3000]|uniref:T. congolense-specific, cell surface-expressed gene family n=1 Tax=Trypanosoma congolense (strain IL3000) TaxID=1068625 RepID=F9W9U6_TRYCI|nr:hypothetical protein, unlikely [Trypanosoma congolense IL3000]
MSEPSLLHRLVPCSFLVLRIFLLRSTAVYRGWCPPAGCVVRNNLQRVFPCVRSHPDRRYGLMSILQTWACSVELISNGSTPRSEGTRSHRKLQDLSLLSAGAYSQLL